MGKSIGVMSRWRVAEERYGVDRGDAVWHSRYERLVGFTTGSLA